MFCTRSQVSLCINTNNQEVVSYTVWLMNMSKIQFVTVSGYEKTLPPCLQLHYQTQWMPQSSYKLRTESSETAFQKLGVKIRLRLKDWFWRHSIIIQEPQDRHFIFCDRTFYPAFITVPLHNDLFSPPLLII